MKDTPDDILRKQEELFLSKTLSERFLIGADLIDFGYGIFLENLRKENPALSETEIKILMIQTCYKNNFSMNELDKIAVSMRNHPL